MNKKAILRAADWLEANPDKHIAEYFALDVDGNMVEPLDERACYFCAVGRLIREVGCIPSYGSRKDAVTRATGVRFDTLDKLLEINDQHTFAGLVRRYHEEPRPLLPNARVPKAGLGSVKIKPTRYANPIVIEALRQIAA